MYPGNAILNSKSKGLTRGLRPSHQLLPLPLLSQGSNLLQKASNTDARDQKSGKKGGGKKKGSKRLHSLQRVSNTHCPHIILYLFLLNPSPASFGFDYWVTSNFSPVKSKCTILSPQQHLTQLIIPSFWYMCLLGLLGCHSLFLFRLLRMFPTPPSPLLAPSRPNLLVLEGPRDPPTSSHICLHSHP